MPERTTSETRDERAQRLLHLGLQVAASIREEPADAVARLLVGLDWAELRDLAMMLAAAVPVESPPSVLLAWWDQTIEYRRRILLGTDKPQKATSTVSAGLST